MMQLWCLNSELEVTALLKLIGQHGLKSTTAEDIIRRPGADPTLNWYVQLFLDFSGFAELSVISNDGLAATLLRVTASKDGNSCEMEVVDHSASSVQTWFGPARLLCLWGLGWDAAIRFEQLRQSPALTRKVQPLTHCILSFIQSTEIRCFHMMPPARILLSTRNDA